MLDSVTKRSRVFLLYSSCTVIQTQAQAADAVLSPAQKSRLEFVPKTLIETLSVLVQTDAFNGSQARPQEWEVIFLPDH